MIHCYYITTTRIRSKAPRQKRVLQSTGLNMVPRIERRSKGREKLPNGDTIAKRLARTYS